MKNVFKCRPLVFLGLLLFYIPAAAQKNTADSVFSDNGTLVSVTGANGQYTAFDENENIIARGPMKEGKREGEWELFDYNFDPSNRDYAFIRSTGRYKNGLKEGEWKFYIGNQGYSTGATWINKKEFFYGYYILSGSYANGRKEGQWIIRDFSNSKPAGTAVFENGRKKGPWILYKGTKAGAIVTITPTFLDSVQIKETFDNGSYDMGYYGKGKKTGSWKRYDNNNQLVQVISADENTSLSKEDFSRINIVLPNLNIEQVNRIVFSAGRQYVLLCDDRRNGDFRYWLWNVSHRKMMASGYLETKKKAWYDISLSDDGRFFYMYHYSDSPPYTSIHVYDIAKAAPVANLSQDGYTDSHFFFYKNELCKVFLDRGKSVSFKSADEKNTYLTAVLTDNRYVRDVLTCAHTGLVIVKFDTEITVYDLGLKKDVLHIPYTDREAGVWTDRSFLITGSDKFLLYDLGRLVKTGGFEIPGYEKGKMDTDHLERYIRFSISPSGKTMAVSFEKNSGFSSPLQVTDLSTGNPVWKSPMNMADCDDAFLLLSDSLIILPRYDKKHDGICSDQLHWFNFRKEEVLYSTNTDKWMEVSMLLQNLQTVTLAYQYPGKIFTRHYNRIDLSTGYVGPLQNWVHSKQFDTWSDSLQEAANGKEKTAQVKKDAFRYVGVGKAESFNKKTPQLPEVFFSEVKTGGFDLQKLIYYAYDGKASFENKTSAGLSPVFWNGKKNTEAQRKVSFGLMDDGEYIFYSPDRYYMSSKNIRKKIYFEQNLKLYPFEQFDLKYNRPDIILSRLGYADTLLIKAYHNAYLKRLKKMHFTEDMLSDDALLPELYIKNMGTIPGQLDTDSLELNLEMQDNRHGIDRINIWINDVPVYGTDGIGINDNSKEKITRRLYLQLASGTNKIQVSVLNRAGVESLRETIYTEVLKNSSKPDLYLVCIGAGQFNDKRYNLQYAAKDARDISAAFTSGTKNLYNRIYTRTLLDEEVTAENIQALKAWLQQAGRNDVVVLTVSDHGVLDGDFNYYLATTGMHFEKPAEKGMPYEKLEDLLDGIKPLKKVLLIDACHSGEIDPEEVKIINEQKNMMASGISFRKAGPMIEKNNLGLQNSTGLMNGLFNDLRRGTGASIISSSSGVELSMEGGQWKNGLFTWCLLQGLTQNKADLDGNGKIMVSELQQYLLTEVSRLSNGSQQPTYRLENSEADFRIW